MSEELLEQETDELQTDLPTEETEEQEEQEESASGPTDEDLAKAARLGWVPKDKYRGDPKRWVDADEFIRRGETELPILRERLRKQDDTIAEMQSTFKEFKEYHTKTVQAQYQKAVRELTAKQLEAVETADVAAFERVQKEMADLQKDFETPKTPETPAPNPVFVEWQSKNDWYGKDKEASAYADLIAPGFERVATPGSPEFFEAIANEVKLRFPQKFSNPQRNAPPAVEGGSVSASRGKKKTYADLPYSAKAACDKYVKNGLTTREQYVADYYEE